MPFAIPRAPSRPVNSGRCEHHQRAAGTFNGFTRHLFCTAAPVFHPILFPCVLQSITDCSPLFPSFFRFLIALSSSSIRHLIYRPLFRVFSLPVVSISFDFFQPFSTPRSPGSLERAARRSFVLGRKKIVARRDTQRASPIFRYANARDRTSERAGGRADGRDGRTVCGMKKIVREKSECSYQSAMQTRGFASVMPGEREREEKKRNDVGRRGYIEALVSARREGYLVRF